MEDDVISIAIPHEVTSSSTQTLKTVVNTRTKRTNTNARSEPHADQRPKEQPTTCQPTTADRAQLPSELRAVLRAVDASGSFSECAPAECKDRRIGVAERPNESITQTVASAWSASRSKLTCRRMCLHSAQTGSWDMGVHRRT
jgi:hypothetical protein